MSREIKFRAWDKDRECFLPVIVGNTDIKDDNWICPLTFCEVNGEKNWYHNETCEIMQYTGLHDKNDKEIYEGDILSDNSLVIWDKRQSSFVMSKEEWLFNHYFGEGVDVENGFADTEVIGNIYDNPELLESEE